MLALAFLNVLSTPSKEKNNSGRESDAQLRQTLHELDLERSEKQRLKEELDELQVKARDTKMALERKDKEVEERSRQVGWVHPRLVFPGRHTEGLMKKEWNTGESKFAACAMFYLHTITNQALLRVCVECLCVLCTCRQSGLFACVRVECTCTCICVCVVYMCFMRL